MKITLEEATKKILALFSSAQPEPATESDKTEEVSEPVALAAEVEEVVETPEVEVPEVDPIEALKADFAAQIAEIKSSFSAQLDEALKANDAKVKEGLEKTFELMQQVASEPSDEPAQQPYKLHQKAHANTTGFGNHFSQILNNK